MSNFTKNWPKLTVTFCNFTVHLKMFQLQLYILRVVKHIFH